MKEPWCLAASTTTDTAKQLMTTYGKRWGIESGFRDTKDLRFGMGMASIRVSTPERRDRLWLLNAFAVALLTSDLLISDGCDWSGVIAKLFAKSMRPTRKAG